MPRTAEADAIDCTALAVNGRIEIWTRDGQILGTHIHLENLPADGVVVLGPVESHSIAEAREVPHLAPAAVTYSQARWFMDANGTRRSVPTVL